MPRPDLRPDPDVILARVRRDDADANRGRLRIYFGASAGVGKTYAMLQAGRRLAAEGRDVVVGVVETHGRRETRALLDGSDAPEILARTQGGAGDGEFDLDAALARKPSLILVDELAHSNRPGARHAKRWQDIEELLAAGIDVFTTLNVQHLESLNDVVGGITGVRVRETVPDTFFDRADEVMLVDIPADELLKRLGEGKVYVPEQAERAAKHFFRKGNLIALREIALRRTADRVEDDVQAYRVDRAIAPIWGTEASLLCCVGPDAGAERVVRAAARLAGQLDVGWRAVYVETPALQRRDDRAREAILRVLNLAGQLGAETAVLSGGDVAEAVALHAREHNLSRIVVGRSHPRARWFARRSVADAIASRLPEVDLIVVGDQAGTRSDEAPASRATHDADDDDRVRPGYVWAALAGLFATAIALLLDPFLHPTNIAMLYLLAVTLVAMRFGRGPAAAASLLSVAAFDFFFVPPRYSFAIADAQYVVTLAVMLTVAFVIGTRGANLRYQARVATHREDRARALYEVARDLSRALRIEDVVGIACDVVGRLFVAEVHVLLPVDDGPTPGRFASLAIDETLARSAGFEPSIAQWSFDQAAPAGAGTDTLNGSPWLFLPLKTTLRARGVLAVRPAKRRVLMIPEQRRLLETLATLVAIAIERVHYVTVAQDAVLRVESERLRNSILSALSHDLRTPIAALAGLAETLAMPGAKAEPLVDAMRDEVRRMSLLVENLLDMARIESGDVRLNRDWHAVEETVGAVLAAVERPLAGRFVETDLPRDLPLVDYDAVLIERVLFNLLENASKYAGATARIRIAARVEPGFLRLTVEDDGPGLPEAWRSRPDALFDKFVRGTRESASTGVGLGLAICRAIVEAHGGTIAFEAPADHGARFVVRLPRGEPPAMEIEPDAAAVLP